MLPCGHPDGCVVTSVVSYCGYCAAEDDVRYWRRRAEAKSLKIEDLKMQLEEYQALYRGRAK